MTIFQAIYEWMNIRWIELKVFANAKLNGLQNTLRPGSLPIFIGGSIFYDGKLGGIVIFSSNKPFIFISAC